jgi:hypothetical protein
LLLSARVVEARGGEGRREGGSDGGVDLAGGRHWLRNKIAHNCYWRPGDRGARGRSEAGSRAGNGRARRPRGCEGSTQVHLFDGVEAIAESAPHGFHLTPEPGFGARELGGFIP